MGSKNMERRTHSQVFIWTAEDKGVMESFFKAYRKDTDENVWNAIDRFQDKVKAERLAEKHRKVLDPIDLRMEPIGEPSQEFTDWVWEELQPVWNLQRDIQGKG